MIEYEAIKLAPITSCTGCMACGDACPKGCISFKMEQDGFWYPHVDIESCVACHACQRACPIISPIVATKKKLPKAYAAWTENEARINSASGGAFYALAEYVIQNGGLVSGAIFEGRKVKHILTNSINDLQYIQGTKYFQSDTSGIYSQIKAILKEGKTVLFCGTSCQVAGLLNIVGGRQSNLITVDLICYGVPSSLTIEVEERMRGKKLKRIISSRDKNHEGGWRNPYYMTCEWEDGTITVSPQQESFMLGSFCSGKVMRNSCYQCPHKTLFRQSDLTVGDYHCVKGFEEQKKRGISLVFVNTEKGLQVLDNCPSLIIHERDIKESLPNKRTIYYNDTIYGKRITRRLMLVLLNKAPGWLLNILYQNIVKSRNPFVWPFTILDVMFYWLNNYNASRKLSILYKSYNETNR